MKSLIKKHNHDISNELVCGPEHVLYYLAEYIDILEKQNKRYLESREVIEQVYKDNYVKNAYGYEDGFLDGLDIAIDIIGRALEGEE